MKRPFADAPRFLRVQAVEKIPELLDALVKSAGEMSKRMYERADEVDFLASGINSVVTGSVSARMMSIGDLMKNPGALSEQAMNAAVLAHEKALAGAKARK